MLRRWRGLRGGGGGGGLGRGCREVGKGRMGRGRWRGGCMWALEMGLRVGVGEERWGGVRDWRIGVEWREEGGEVGARYVTVLWLW